MTLEQVVDDVGTGENALFDTQKPCFQTLKRPFSASKNGHLELTLLFSAL
jgi:hypothetical protein